MTTTSTPHKHAQDAQHQPLSEVDKLRQDARAAAEKRALQTHPDVVALRVERIRSQVDGLMWAGLLLGLAFTMVNVQTFAAAGAAVGSLPWVAAWLLDPMVSLVLIAVLRAEQVTARWQVDMHTGPWVRCTKVFAFLATYTMNTWQSWSEGHAAGIVLHSVPPAMVYLAAETGPILRDRLTEAVLCAARMLDGTDHATANGASAVDTVPANVTLSTPDTPAPAAREATGQRRTSRPRTSSPRTGSKTAGKPRTRTSRAEYLSRARAAHRPGVVVTPAWVREVAPEIGRGTSKVVADLLNDELTQHTTTPATTPATVPYPAPAADQPTEQGRAA